MKLLGVYQDPSLCHVSSFRSKYHPPDSDCLRPMCFSVPLKLSSISCTPDRNTARTNCVLQDWGTGLGVEPLR